MVQQVEFNTKNPNPFYGMRNTLSIFQKASKGLDVDQATLQAAWKEADDTNKRAMLLALLFSIGDVTARKHNIFEKRVDSGGNSQREVFRDTIIPFIVKNYGKKDIQTLMSLITEYTVMDNILANRVQTRKKSAQVIRVINMIDVFGEDNVVDYCANIITKGSTFQKVCLAKFLPRPRFSKRPNSNKMLPQTAKVMERQARLYTKISDKVNFSYKEHQSYTNYHGFYAWRKKYNKDFESVLFSSKSINDFDKEEFMEFINTCPADARFRVKNKIMYGDKWAKFQPWYTEFEKFKEKAQAEQRALESQIASGEVRKEDVAEKLKDVKKKAKVTTGSMSFDKMFKDIINGTVDKIKVQPFIDKVNLPYNTLVFVDDSGSMASTWRVNQTGFTPRQFAAFIATICLMKNPEPEAKSLMGLFSRTCRMFTGVESVAHSPNSIINAKTRSIKRKALINQKAHFIDNLMWMRRFLDANTQGQMTYLSSVPDHINQWVGGDPAKLEELQRYPVWTFISDGNFNNSANATTSYLDFKRRCENYFGFSPFLILIDVAGETSQKITTFEGADGIMMVPPNPAAIEMFLTRFRDMDVADIYTPLQSIYRSNRYQPVKHFVYQEENEEIPQEATV